MFWGRRNKGGFFVVPTPTYQAYREVFKNVMEHHDHEWLIANKNRFSRGIEVPTISFEYLVNIGFLR
jgi:hypothetical protein